MRAVERRAELVKSGRTQAYRVFSGDAEGYSGVFIDVYGSGEACGAVMIVYEGRTPPGFGMATAARDAHAVLERIGVRGVYVKHFPKDRPKLGGELPEELTSATPTAGVAVPEAVIIREVDWNLEVRLYDGLSTGLFLDQRENRATLADAVRRKVGKTGRTVSVLNTFAYTCAFSVACAKAGAATTSVDVSARYLEWGKRNFAHNGIDVTPRPDARGSSPHRFAKMDTFEFFDYARRKGLMYDLIILDPPSFAAGNKKKGIRTFSSVSDYGKLVREAASLLNEGGAIFASTNTQELCRPLFPGQPARLEREICKGLGLAGGLDVDESPRWLKLPPAAADFAMERDRFAARWFVP